MAKQAFKVTEVNSSNVKFTNAEGQSVTVGMHKQPLLFLKVRNLAVGDDYQLDVQMSSNNNLQSTAWAKVDTGLIKALELQARLDKAVGTSARYARMATADVENED